MYFTKIVFVQGKLRHATQIQDSSAREGMLIIQMKIYRRSTKRCKWHIVP